MVPLSSSYTQEDLFFISVSKLDDNMEMADLSSEMSTLQSSILETYQENLDRMAAFAQKIKQAETAHREELIDQDAKYQNLHQKNISVGMKLKYENLRNGSVLKEKEKIQMGAAERESQWEEHCD